MLRDYLIADGATDLTGSRSTTRLAFNVGLVDDGQVWMDMIEGRSLAHGESRARAAMGGEVWGEGRKRRFSARGGFRKPPCF